MHNILSILSPPFTFSSIFSEIRWWNWMKIVKWYLTGNLHSDVMNFAVFISYSLFMHPNNFIYVFVCYLCCTLSSSFAKQSEVVLHSFSVFCLFFFLFRMFTANFKSKNVWAVQIISVCIIKHLSTINFIVEVFPVNNLSDEVSSFCDLPTKLFFILIKNLSLVIFQPTVYVNTFQPSVVHLLFTLTSHYSLLIICTSWLAI